MNSMHNSFSGPGGYSGAYPGYVPPSALPYYNGYPPGELSQSSNPYYGKPPTAVPAGYTSSMGNYTPPINNSSMYYQQYGLGYQYGYGKYGLGYSSEISSGPGIHPPSIGTLQAPTTDLGLTGSMFSKNNKFSGGQGSSSPHQSGLGLGHGGSSSILSPATPNTPSPGPHPMAGNLRGTGATPSPPVEMNDGKKDLEKMRRCPTCGQVFRLMSECLAHMKSVHESPLNVYNLPHGAAPQSLASAAGLPPHSLPGSLGPPTSRHVGMGAPDSPLMALERMGWGEKQNLLPLQSSSSLTPSYTPAPSLTTNPQHLSSVPLGIQQSVASTLVQTSSSYGSGPHISSQHQSPIHHSPQHNSPAPSLPAGQQSNLSSSQNSPAVSESEGIYSQPPAPSSDMPNNPPLNAEGHVTSLKIRRTNSYSVSSIIGETNDKEQTEYEDTSENVEAAGNSRCLSENKIENAADVEQEQESAINLSAHEQTSVNKYAERLDQEKVSHQNKELNTREEVATASETNENLDESAVPANIEAVSYDQSEGDVQQDQDEDAADVTAQDDSQNNWSSSETETKNTQETAEDYSASMPQCAESVDSLGCKIDAADNSEQNSQDELTISSNSQEINLSSQYQKDKQDVNSEKTSDDSKLEEANMNDEPPEHGNDSIKENDLTSQAKVGSNQVHTGQDQVQYQMSQMASQSPHSLRPASQGQQLATQQIHPQPHPGQSSSQQMSSPQQVSSPQLQGQPSQLQHSQHQSPVGMYHPSNLKQPSFSNWPMSANPSFPGQFSYPCNQGSSSQPSVSQQQPPPNSVSGGPMCNKPHGYPPVHQRYPSQYHQQGISGGSTYGPHDHVRPPAPQSYLQGHPQNHSTLSQAHPSGHPQGHSSNLPPGHTQHASSHPPSNWFPPTSRSDAKTMWSSWPNQAAQAYPQGFYGYTGNNPPQGQKHHQLQHNGPPPAHVHPSNSPHVHTVPQHLQQQQPPAQTSPVVQKPSHLQSAPPQPAQLQPPQPSGPATPAHQTHMPSQDSTKDHVTPVKSELLQQQQNSALATKLEQMDDNSLLMQHRDKQLSSNEDLSESYEYSERNFSKIEESTGLSADAEFQTARKQLHKIGPKSKTMVKQINQAEDLDSYKCSMTLQENGSLNGYGSQSSVGTVGAHSCDSSDSEVASEDGPTFTLLRPIKRKYKNMNRDGAFVGPKRIKLAKQVRERQEWRQKCKREQMRQSELEEQLLAQRAEIASDLNGPLANILLQSSILLSDSKVEGSDSVEERIASLKAEQQASPFPDISMDGDNDKMSFASIVSSAGSKKPGRKSQSKVLHNENSVIVKDIAVSQSLRKLRAKDFKWSHYIKSMRYWCSDCAQGFKNQKEAGMHSEERCKWNCLYMLECYVAVNDVQTHPAYGSKVQELLEEYQIDGQHNCMTCGDIIARKADYLVHVDSHKDFMPWECTICGTRFKIRGSLKEHLRYTHMKGRVPCLKCNKVFPTSTLLRQHVKVHTQHYKYKTAKNREEELRAAMEATAGALEPPALSQEESEKMSHEANEYRNWCKLMEMNAMKNLATSGSGGNAAGGSVGDEDEDDRGDGDDSMMGMGDDSSMGSDALALDRNYAVRSVGDSKGNMSSNS